MKNKFLKIFLIAVGLLIYTGCEKIEEPTSNTKVESEFTISYQGSNVLPGTEFNKALVNETPEYSEIESCAFEGIDKVYTYNDIEITTSTINGKEIIYSVYFLNEEMLTSEGIKISDEKTKMIEKYGNTDDNFNNQYSYKKNDVQLAFIIENDVITSIEYKYIIEN